MFEVVGTNALMEGVWGAGMADRVSSPERSFIVALSTKQFADRILNWDEAMTLVARMIEGRPRQYGAHTSNAITEQESDALDGFGGSGLDIADARRDTDEEDADQEDDE